MESLVKIDFHPLATRELEASADWYAERSQEAGRCFAIAVDEAIHKMVDNPDRFQKLDARHQVCGVERFPFQIVFRHIGNRIVVIAVAHAKRRPGYWRHR